ncbi:MAG: DUF4380 domain-containing protein [Phycisphaerales bacterium JB038]
MQRNRVGGRWNVTAAALVTLAVAPGCQVLQAVNPDDPARPGNVVRLERNGVVLSYRPDIDRVIFFGASGGPNMLHTVGLDRRPAHDESYTFYGGCYSWVAPQRGEWGWRAADGTASDWPPDPAMDRGPMEVVKRSHDSLTARSPIMRNGLREYVTFTMVGSNLVEVVRELENVGEQPTQASIWSITAVEPGATVALRQDAVGHLWSEASHEAEAFRSLLTPDDEHFRFSTAAATNRDGVKVYFDAEAYLAVHKQGWWFVRDGLSRDHGSLKEVGEAPIALYLHPELEIFEAELYGPLREIAPGERLDYTEYWLLQASYPPDCAVLP